MILQDSDMRLRPSRLPEDLLAAWAWYHDSEVIQFAQVPGSTAMNWEQIAGMYYYQQHHGEFYIIEVQTPAGWHAIGDVGLEEDNLPIVIGEAAYRSQGLGRRIVKLLLARARALGWTSVQAKYVWENNVRSQRLFAGCGFRRQENIQTYAGHRYFCYRLTFEPEENAVD
ncbi:MAG: GNAT family N-acetyltransferase [Firmicutes bacterium]|nr:GNAT family N-acetyltransferase [Bacillota bacterium]